MAKPARDRKGEIAAAGTLGYDHRNEDHENGSSVFGVDDQRTSSEVSGKSGEGHQVTRSIQQSGLMPGKETRVSEQSATGTHSVSAAKHTGSQSVSTLKSGAESARTVEAATLTSGPFVKTPAVQPLVSPTLEPGSQTAVATLSSGPSVTTLMAKDVVDPSGGSQSQISVDRTQNVAKCNEGSQTGLQRWNIRDQAWQANQLPDAQRDFWHKTPLSHSEAFALNHGPEPIEPWGTASAVDLSWRGSPPLLVQGASAPSSDRNRRSVSSQDGQGEKPAASVGDQLEQSGSQEVRFGANGHRVGSPFDRQRDMPDPSSQGLGQGRSNHTRPSARSTGIWKVLPKDLHGGVLGGTGLLQVGDADGIRGQLVPTSSAPGPVVEPARSQGCQHDVSQQEEAAQGESSRIKDPELRCGSDQQQQPSSARDQSTAVLPGGISQDVGSGSGGGEARRQGIEETHDILRGRDHFEQRVGGSEPGMNLPSMYNSDGEETEEPILSASKLSLQEARALDWKGERLMPECMEALVQMRRPVLYEIACGPDSVLTEKVRDATGSKESAKRFAFWNGYDVGSTTGVRAILAALKRDKPLSVWLSLECGPFSKMQQINQRTPQQVEDLRQKREACIRMYVGGLIIFTYCAQHGIPVTWEWPETCDAWRLPMVQRVFAKYSPWFVVVKGCRVQLTDGKTGGLMGKGWKLATTHDGIAKLMDLPCKCVSKHVPCEGKLTRQTAYYTKDFAKRVCRALLQPHDTRSLFHEIRGEQKGAHFHKGFPKECTCQVVHHPKSNLACSLCELGNEMCEPLSLVGEEDVEEETPLTEEEKEQCIRKIALLHRNSGHGPMEHLVKALEARHTDPRVVALAKQYECSVCKELSRQVPRPRVSLEPLPPKWSTVQVDNAHWTHPKTHERVQFTIMIDEGSRFRVGKVMCKGPGGVKADQLIQFYQENWKPVFGKPVKLRMDPAGPWRSNSTVEYFDKELIELDVIPAEAHWGMSHVERAIACTKHIMSKLGRSEDDITPEEALAEALRTENEREIVRGFSPAQLALGRAPDDLGRFVDPSARELPDVLCENPNGEFHRNNERMKQAELAMTEFIYNERLKRAQNTRSHKLVQYVPGDLVFVWRVQNKDPAVSTRRGGFTGPCRVLATETRSTEGGELRPTSSVWLVRGNRLIKANERQLRHASTREEYIEQLANPVTLPWTLTKLTDDIGGKQFEDVSEEIPEPMELEQAVDEETQAPFRRVRQKRWCPECPPKPSQEVRGEHPEDGNQFGHFVECSFHEDFQDYYSECFWSNPNSAVEIEISIPETNRGKKYMSEHFQSFLVSQLRRRAVEVSERNMSEEELELMKQAKHEEVKKFISADALLSLPPHLQPNRALAMRMRWVLTWKRSEDGSKSAKARCVVLGYQDPNYEHRQTMAPTMSRTTRQVLLSLSAALKLRVAKGDVSGAFLQGRSYQHDAYVIPTDEICDAMSIPSGSVTKLKKACYGLVDAPLEWFLTVSDFLQSIGFQRCVCDPCCFKYVDPKLGLIGLISGHVDDFLFCGRSDCQKWKSLCQQIQQKFKWGTWEYDSFVQCGVKIEATSDGGFQLSQAQYIDDIKEISISSERRREPKAWTSESEKTKIRAALGALSWCAQQSSPQLSAAVSLFLSQVRDSTVSTMIDINKLIYRTKCNRKHMLKIHGNLQVKDLLVAGWADAACQNRPDGKSTEGIFIGLTSQRLLQGEMCSVSPVLWRSAKIERQCRSPGASEALAAIDCEDSMYAVRLQVFEMLGNTVNVRKTEEQVAMIPGVLVTDSTNVHDRMKSEVYVPKGPEHRTSLELLGLKEGIVRTNTPVRWVHSDAQLANSLTKDSEQQQLQRFYNLGQCWKIIDDPLMRSARNRKSAGLEVFEEDTAAKSAVKSISGGC